ncbi:MAG TPA: heme exporter protein CcmB [Armatimonadota bacterium]|jgi:heme exporter protein B
MMRAALALVKKDALAESRSRTALNASLLFAVTSLVAVAFSLGPRRVAPSILASILWVVIFFAATAGLARSFVAEEESGTALALRMAGKAHAVLLGKLLANLGLMLVLEAVVLPLFLLLMALPIANWRGFACVLLLGTIGLSAAATVSAALVAKARGRGELFAAIAFPLLIPALIGGIRGTQACLPGSRAALDGPIELLIAFDGLLLTVAFLVFEVLWEE